MYTQLQINSILGLFYLKKFVLLIMHPINPKICAGLAEIDKFKKNNKLNKPIKKKKRSIDRNIINQINLACPWNPRIIN